MIYFVFFDVKRQFKLSLGSRRNKIIFGLIHFLYEMMFNLCDNEVGLLLMVVVE